MSEMPRTRSKKHLVLNEIEKLNASYPGLACYVKGWFDLKKPTDAIPALLQKQFGVTVSSSVLENYRCTVWAPEKELIALKSATAKAAIDAFGGDVGFDALLLAKLWELMDRMTITQLLAARTLFIRIKAQNLKEQEFLFKTGQLKPGQAAGQEVDPETRSRNALRKFKEIFGLAGNEPPKPPVPRLPQAVEKVTVESRN